MTMDRKNNDVFVKGGKKAEDEHPSFRTVVSEGSTVVLDARDLVNDIGTIPIKYYSWEQIAGTPIVNGDVKDKSSYSFTAPYVEHNDYNTPTDNPVIPLVYSNLSIQLTITDNDGNKRGPHIGNIIVKRVQRAIIFQGGVALGAYEAGVFQAIVEKLLENNEAKKRKGLDNEKRRPLFDIVAGTSIGAMNAAIVVSSVMSNKGMSLEDPKNWEDSVEKVKQFWKVQEQLPTFADIFDMNPFYHYSWEIIHNTSKVFKHSFTELIELYSHIIDPDLKKWLENSANWSLVDPSFLKDYFIDSWYIPATAEAARRYYSANQLHRFPPGPLNVASGIVPWSLFGKFFNFADLLNWFPRPDNKHFIYYSLKRTLEQFVDFPINTSPDKRKESEQLVPRLLLVTVDVKTGDAVTFDSYSEKAKYHDKENFISSPRGIEIQHALATGTFPDFFDYPKFKVENYEMGVKGEERVFWDGGFRSNTPLREVLQTHRDYWLRRAKVKDQQLTRRRKHLIDQVQDVGKENDDGEYDKYENVVPDLEIYIADLWPSELKEDPVSFDRDFVENKQWNLILGDKTDYDEQVASVVTDYVDLARRLKSLAEQKGVPKKEISRILSGYATSVNTIGKRRIYNELLEGRFRLTKVVHVDHKDDGNEISDKVFDYSYKTIEDLMKVGYQDTLVQMDLQRVKDRVVELAQINGRNGIEKRKAKENNHIQKLEEYLHQIEENLKVENAYDNTLNRIDKIIHEVESMIDQNENGLSLKANKDLLIDAAKQFQETIVTTSPIRTRQS
jgi:NTE family protein